MVNENRIVIDKNNRYVYQTDWGKESLYYCKKLNQYMGINKETGFKKKYEAGLV